MNARGAGQVERLWHDAVFAREAVRSFAVLDGASIPDLRERLAAHRRQHTCLFAGDIPDDVVWRAPHLVELERDDALTGFLTVEAWGRHPGIVAAVPATVRFPQVRKHFKGFLRVRDPDDRPLLFRYYDPRVLRVYLPTCTPSEAALVFGPVVAYAMESDAALVLFERSAEGVARRELPLPQA